VTKGALVGQLVSEKSLCRNRTAQGGKKQIHPDGASPIGAKAIVFSSLSLRPGCTMARIDGSVSKGSYVAAKRFRVQRVYGSSSSPC